ncbi:MAG TPA: YggS family pyridoxal phosphate-dependent enzyme [Kofleriaceae bacterium]
MTIADNWASVRTSVHEACDRAGRDPASVTIIAVGKTHPASAIAEAAAAGATDFGENYAQELAEKQAVLDLPLSWHFIGRLQSNKAKLVAGKVALVHAVEGTSLAQELGKRAGGVQPLLISVNLGGEATKGGVTAAALPELAREITAIPNVRLDGLMTMPPPEVDPKPLFDELRTLRDRLRDDLGLPLPVLSMGMSSDFATAISCGATHVRIGTAIFGRR